MEQKIFYHGIKEAIPVCFGVIPVGISYGLFAIQSGLTPFQTILMSLLVMAGSSQLMVVGMIAHATVLSMIMATFFINLRNIVMSSAVMNRLKDTALSTKMLCAFALCDESFALFSLSCSNHHEVLFGANCALYISWVISSGVGCLLGQILPELIIKSFAITFYAAFLAMLIPNITKIKRTFYLVILTALINTLLQIFLASSWSIVLSMVISAMIGTTFVEVTENDAK